MKKLSVYFKADTFTNLHKFQASYLLSGKDTSKMPKISEVLEAIISMELNLLRENPDEKEILRAFISGNPKEQNNQDALATEQLESIPLEGENENEDFSEMNYKYEGPSGTDRFLFVVSDQTEKEIKEIIQRISYKGSYASAVRDITDKFFFESGSRTADYIILFTRSYVGYLYSLTLRSSYYFSLACTNTITVYELIKTIDEEAISIIRQIVLEDAKISEFKKFLKMNRLMESLLSIKDLGNYIFLIRRKSYWKQYSKFYDRSKNFNYIQAYVGYHMFIGFKNFYKYYLGIPTPIEIFINFKRVSLSKPGKFSNVLDDALSFSKKLNSLL